MILWLVALYPEHWRERYGDEFEALLEAQPATPAAFLDVILGAIDAHLTGEKGVSSMVAGWRAPSAATVALGGLVWFAGRVGGEVVHFGSPSYLVEAAGLLVVALGVVGLMRLPDRGQPLAVRTGSLAVLGLLMTGGIEFFAMLAPRTFQQVAEFGPWPFSIALAGLVAQAAFAGIVVVLNALPRRPSAAIAAASLALTVAALAQNVGVRSAAPFVQWLVLILPLCWASLGLAMLVVPASRRGAAVW